MGVNYRDTTDALCSGKSIYYYTLYVPIRSDVVCQSQGTDLVETNDTRRSPIITKRIAHGFFPQAFPLLNWALEEINASFHIELGTHNDSPKSIDSLL